MTDNLIDNLNEIDRNRFKAYSQEVMGLDKKFWDSIDYLRDYVEDFRKREARSPRMFTVVYGCQMNEHDNEKIAWILKLMGYEEAKSLEDADFMVFNTCAIRENAELKVYGKIGSLKTLKEKRPDIKIALCGCMMQIDGIRETILEKYGHVDLIFGTHNIHRLPELFVRNLKTSKTAVDVMEDSFEIVEGMEDLRVSQHKAYVNIMFGCNNFCTYCVVPYTRGREISRRPEDILAEIEKLAELGYKEVTLLGQNVNSYGKTLNIDYSFPDLLRDINKIDSIRRIRFMTSHPRDISDDLIGAYGELENLANHLHLPVQSGSNEILRRMNRHYSREKYLKAIDKVRSLKPDIAISTDIIVGFPGETEEDFEATLSLVREVEYDFVYSFIYSVRPGTKAGEMEGQLPYEVKHERFERLTQTINDISLRKNQALVGQVLEVLVDEPSKSNSEMLSGRTEEFKLVHFRGDRSLIGQLVELRITEAGTFSLEGSLL